MHLCNANPKSSPCAPSTTHFIGRARSQLTRRRCLPTSRCSMIVSCQPSIRRALGAAGLRCAAQQQEEARSVMYKPHFCSAYAALTVVFVRSAETVVQLH